MVVFCYDMAQSCLRVRRKIVLLINNIITVFWNCHWSGYNEKRQFENCTIVLQARKNYYEWKRSVKKKTVKTSTFSKELTLQHSYFFLKKWNKSYSFKRSRYRNIQIRIRLSFTEKRNFNLSSLFPEISATDTSTWDTMCVHIICLNILLVDNVLIAWISALQRVRFGSRMFPQYVHDDCRKSIMTIRDGIYPIFMHRSGYE